MTSRAAMEDECRTAADALRSGRPGLTVLVIAVVLEGHNRSVATGTSCVENPTPADQAAILAGVSEAVVEWSGFFDIYR